MRSSKKCKRFGDRLSLALLLVFAGSLTAQAQQTVTSATLSGRVEDSSGAVIQGASVTIRNLETNATQTMVSDGEGRFRFPYLHVGRHEIVLEKSGFARLTRQLTLTVGQAVDLPLKLTVGDVAENVEVAADLPGVESTRTQLAETLLPREIDDLPLNGRNYLDLAALTPGVTRSNPTANQRFPETSAVPGSGLSITGQRFINNGFVVDGLSANDDAADLPGTFYSQEVDSRVSGNRFRRNRRVWPGVGRLHQHHHAIGNKQLSWQGLRLLAQSALRRAKSAGKHHRSADAGTIWD